ncbi:MAG TPA: hypothetical protein VFT87_00005 [Candidatus Saccharimonadales bacterium]|nr:hypothetical protein [Candidatus Saccharimonadales bacterium]
MSETLTTTVVIEGRPPLEGQSATRQTHFLENFDAAGIRTVFIDNPKDPTIYDADGRLLGLTPGEYAWRLRDVVWEDGDPAAFRDGDGYNSQKARNLTSREAFAAALREVGLEAYGVETRPSNNLKGWKPGEFVFLKPNTISDIHDPEKSPGTRARLIRSDRIGEALAEPLAGGAVLQRPKKLMAARDLADQLGLPADELEPGVDYLHALRVFTPLWLPLDQTPAIELRLTNRGNDAQSDIGKLFATKIKLLEPELVFTQLPEVAKLHRLVHEAFSRHYGKQNYLAFDYIICKDGSVKILNGLVRALTPNLEPQPEEVKHLARKTADVEVEHLKSLARKLARPGRSVR